MAETIHKKQAWLDEMASIVQRDINTFSAASLAIPYGSTGLGSESSVNGGLILPYLAIEEQKTILFTLLLIAAEKTLTLD